MRWSRLWFRRPRGRHAAGRGLAQPLPRIPLAAVPVAAGLPLAPSVPQPAAAEPVQVAVVPTRSPADVQSQVREPAPPAAAPAAHPVVELGFADGQNARLSHTAPQAAALLAAATRLLRTED